MRIKQILIAAVIGVLLGLFIGRMPANRNAALAVGEPVVSAVPANLGEDEKNTIQIFRRVANSVVFITSSSKQIDFFSMQMNEVQRGSGSGFIWDGQGHVVTNYHVIADASSLSVTLQDGKNFNAEVVGVDASKDLAVLKIDVSRDTLKPVVVGHSDRLLVGQKVLAIGNPFGLDETLTVGVVSALGREIQSVTNRTIHDVIQTDAAINPGNSGGPLLDSSGNLIGVNTAIYSPSGANAGIGFAVPVNTVKRIIPQLIQHGKVIRPGFGASFLADHAARRFGVEGVMVARVPSGSAAEKAGLRGVEQTERGEIIAGDVVTKINDKTVRSFDELANVLESFRVGDTVSVEFTRHGEKKSTRMTLQEVE